MKPLAAMAGEKLKNMHLYDRWLLLAILGILAMGILMVASASIVISEQYYGNPFYFTIRQTISLLLGIIAAFFVLKIPVQFWQRMGGPLLLLSFILLLFVLIPGLGHTVNGARRWLMFGPLRVQPAELAKLFIIIYLAGYLVRHEQAVRTTLLGFIKPIFVLTILASLLLLEPDFGSAVVVFSTALMMLFLAGSRLGPFFVLMFSGCAALALLAISSPYRLRRLTAFLDPWVNQFDSGYQLTQSLIAFGRGGWFGTGLGESVQKLFYLPESHTDFLFAVLAEELGLFGMLAILFLFSLFIYRGVLVGRRCSEINWPFGAYLAFGITLWLGLQAFVNIGVNTGLLPTKGLTLPLMSYGGASLITAVVSIALLLRVDYEARCELLGMRSINNNLQHHT